LGETIAFGHMWQKDFIERRALILALHNPAGLLARHL